jgi:hypothetical protein
MLTAVYELWFGCFLAQAEAERVRKRALRRARIAEGTWWPTNFLSPVSGSATATSSPVETATNSGGPATAPAAAHSLQHPSHSSSSDAINTASSAFFPITGGVGSSDAATGADATQATTTTTTLLHVSEAALRAEEHREAVADLLSAFVELHGMASRGPCPCPPSERMLEDLSLFALRMNLLAEFQELYRLFARSVPRLSSRFFNQLIRVGIEAPIVGPLELEELQGSHSDTATNITNDPAVTTEASGTATVASGEASQRDSSHTAGSNPSGIIPPPLPARPARSGASARPKLSTFASPSPSISPPTVQQQSSSVPGNAAEEDADGGGESLRTYPSTVRTLAQCGRCGYLLGGEDVVVGWMLHPDRHSSSCPVCEGNVTPFLVIRWTGEQLGSGVGDGSAAASPTADGDTVAIPLNDASALATAKVTEKEVRVEWMKPSAIRPTIRSLALLRRIPGAAATNEAIGFASPSHHITSSNTSTHRSRPATLQAPLPQFAAASSEVGRAEYLAAIRSSALLYWNVFFFFAMRGPSSSSSSSFGREGAGVGAGAGSAGAGGYGLAMGQLPFHFLFESEGRDSVLGRVCSHAYTSECRPYRPWVVRAENAAPDAEDDHSSGIALVVGASMATSAGASDELISSTSAATPLRRRGSDSATAATTISGEQPRRGSLLKQGGLPGFLDKSKQLLSALLEPSSANAASAGAAASDNSDDAQQQRRRASSTSTREASTSLSSSSSLTLKVPESGHHHPARSDSRSATPEPTSAAMLMVDPMSASSHTRFSLSSSTHSGITTADDEATARLQRRSSAVMGHVRFILFSVTYKTLQAAVRAILRARRERRSWTAEERAPDEHFFSGSMYQQLALLQSSDSPTATVDPLAFCHEYKAALASVDSSIEQHRRLIERLDNASSNILQHSAGTPAGTGHGSAPPTPLRAALGSTTSPPLSSSHATASATHDKSAPSGAGGSVAGDGGIVAAGALLQTEDAAILESKRRKKEATVLALAEFVAMKEEITALDAPPVPAALQLLLSVRRVFGCEYHAAVIKAQIAAHRTHHQHHHAHSRRSSQTDSNVLVQHATGSCVVPSTGTGIAGGGVSGAAVPYASMLDELLTQEIPSLEDVLTQTSQNPAYTLQAFTQFCARFRTSAEMRAQAQQQQLLKAAASAASEGEPAAAKAVSTTSTDSSSSDAAPSTALSYVQFWSSVRRWRVRFERNTHQRSLSLVTAGPVATLASILGSSSDALGGLYHDSVYESAKTIYDKFLAPAPGHAIEAPTPNASSSALATPASAAAGVSLVSDAPSSRRSSQTSLDSIAEQSPAAAAAAAAPLSGAVPESSPAPTAGAETAQPANADSLAAHPIGLVVRVASPDGTEQSAVVPGNDVAAAAGTLPLSITIAATPAAAAAAMVVAPSTTSSALSIPSSSHFSSNPTPMSASGHVTTVRGLILPRPLHESIRRALFEVPAAPASATAHVTNAEDGSAAAAAAALPVPPRHGIAPKWLFDDVAQVVLNWLKKHTFAAWLEERRKEDALQREQQMQQEQLHDEEEQALVAKAVGASASLAPPPPIPPRPSPSSARTNQMPLATIAAAETPTVPTRPSHAITASLLHPDSLQALAAVSGGAVASQLHVSPSVAAAAGGAPAAASASASSSSSSVPSVSVSVSSSPPPSARSSPTSSFAAPLPLLHNLSSSSAALAKSGNSPSPRISPTHRATHG